MWYVFPIWEKRMLNEGYNFRKGKIRYLGNFTHEGTPSYFHLLIGSKIFSEEHRVRIEWSMPVLKCAISSQDSLIEYIFFLSNIKEFGTD